MVIHLALLTNSRRHISCCKKPSRLGLNNNWKITRCCAGDKTMVLFRKKIHRWRHGLFSFFLISKFCKTSRLSPFMVNIQPWIFVVVSRRHILVVGRSPWTGPYQTADSARESFHLSNNLNLVGSEGGILRSIKTWFLWFLGWLITRKGVFLPLGIFYIMAFKLENCFATFWSAKDARLCARIPYPR